MKEKMRAEEKANVTNSVGRIIFAALCILLQIIWFLVLAIRLNEYSTVISFFTSVITVVVVLRIYVNYENAAFKMPWIILLLAFPVMGLCIYMLFGHKEVVARKRKQFEQTDKQLFPLLVQDEAVMKGLEQTDFAVANQCRYIRNYGKFPVYQNTDVVFYAEALEGFEAQLEELKKAEKFIFMEYHAIEEAESFARLKTVLAGRAEAGVEVRLIYDDIGSGAFIDHKFIKRMEEIGVQCVDFNPVVPFLNLFMNNRDHRKITVIDGKVGFTGGYNLADEYFNITHPYGYWKDTGVKITGDAVRSLTALFLEMWNAMRPEDEEFEKYLPKVSDPVQKPQENVADGKNPENVSDGKNPENISDRKNPENVAGGKNPENISDQKNPENVAGGKNPENVSDRKNPENIDERVNGGGYVQPYADSPLDDEALGENVYLNMIKNAKHRLYVATPYLIISDEMNRELGLAAKRGVDVRVITPGIPDKKLVYKMTRSYYAGLVRQGVRIFEYTPGFLHEKQVLCDDECAVVGTINFDYRSLYHHFENGVFLYACQAVKDIAADFEETMEKSKEVTDYYKSGRPAVIRGAQALLRLFAPLL